jgi:predicted signal transduction protein with EAL and GGDEF domain
MKVRDTAGELLSVTVSIGVASYQQGDTVESLVDRADRAMYVAKSSGRNRVARGWDSAQDPDLAGTPLAPVRSEASGAH